MKWSLWSFNASTVFHRWTVFIGRTPPVAHTIHNPWDHFSQGLAHMLNPKYHMVSWRFFGESPNPRNPIRREVRVDQNSDCVVEFLGDFILTPENEGRKEPQNQPKGKSSEVNLHFSGSIWIFQIVLLEGWFWGWIMFVCLMVWCVWLAHGKKGCKKRWVLGLIGDGFGLGRSGMTAPWIFWGKDQGWHHNVLNAHLICYIGEDGDVRFWRSQPLKRRVKNPTKQLRNHGNLPILANRCWPDHGVWFRLPSFYWRWVTTAQKVVCVKSRPNMPCYIEWSEVWNNKVCSTFKYFTPETWHKPWNCATVWEN